MQQSAELLVSKGCTLVLDLDGGGSAAMVYKINGSQVAVNAMYVNSDPDDRNLKGRSLSDFIFLK